MDVLSVDVADSVEVAEGLGIASAHLTADSPVVIDCSRAFSGVKGTEEPVDEAVVLPKLVLTMGIDKEDGVLVEEPGDGPVSVPSDIPICACSVCEIEHGCEDLVKVDESVGNDVAPNTVGDLGSLGVAEDEAFDTAGIS